MTKRIIRVLAAVFQSKDLSAEFRFGWLQCMSRLSCAELNNDEPVNKSYSFHLADITGPFARNANCELLKSDSIAQIQREFGKLRRTESLGDGMTG